MPRPTSTLPRLPVHERVKDPGVCVPACTHLSEARTPLGGVPPGRLPAVHGRLVLLPLGPCWLWLWLPTVREHQLWRWLSRLWLAVDEIELLFEELFIAVNTHFPGFVITLRRNRKQRQGDQTG